MCLTSKINKELFFNIKYIITSYLKQCYIKYIML